MRPDVNKPCGCWVIGAENFMFWPDRIQKDLLATERWDSLPDSDAICRLCDKCLAEKKKPHRSGGWEFL